MDSNGCVIQRTNHDFAPGRSVWQDYRFYYTRRGIKAAAKQWPHASPFSLQCLATYSMMLGVPSFGEGLQLRLAASPHRPGKDSLPRKPVLVNVDNAEWDLWFDGISQTKAYCIHIHLICCWLQGWGNSPYNVLKIAGGRALAFSTAVPVFRGVSSEVQLSIFCLPLCWQSCLCSCCGCNPTLLGLCRVQMFI